MTAGPQAVRSGGNSPLSPTLATRGIHSDVPSMHGGAGKDGCGDPENVPRLEHGTDCRRDDGDPDEVRLI